MIPKIIHQMAPKSRFLWHPFWGKCHMSWKKHFPESEYEHILWDDAKIDEFIENQFPDYVNFYYSLPFHILQLDFARYCILYKYGGIYVDMDFYCFKNFYESIDKQIFFMHSPFPGETIQNSLFGSVKNNKHILNIINECKKTFYYYEIIDDVYSKERDFYVLSICGPVLISKYYNNLEENSKNKIQILEENKFNPGIINNQVEDLNINCIHLLTGHWGKNIITSIMQDSGKNNFAYGDYSKKLYKKLRPQIYELMKQFLM